MQHDSLLQIVMAILAHFFKNLNLMRQVQKPAPDYNGCLARFKFKKSAKWPWLSAAGCYTWLDGQHCPLRTYHGVFSRAKTPAEDIICSKCHHKKKERGFKGTQDREIFWLRIWNLRYFFVSYVNILRFYKKKCLIGPFLGEVRFFRVVLGLRGMKKNFELGSKIFSFFLQLWTLNMTQYSFFENSIN